MMTEPLWTLVQHSGYGNAGNVTFCRAVELRRLYTPREVNLVRRAGGVLLASYDDAAFAEMAANYPGEVKGLVPRVRGGFSTTKIDGLRIYVPTDEERTML